MKIAQCLKRSLELFLGILGVTAVFAVPIAIVLSVSLLFGSNSDVAPVSTFSDFETEDVNDKQQDAKCEKRKLELQDVCNVDDIAALGILALRECEWLHADEASPMFPSSCESPYFALELPSWPIGLQQAKSESLPFRDALNEKCLSTKIGEMTVGELSLCAERLPLLVGPVRHILELSGSEQSDPNSLDFIE